MSSVGDPGPASGEFVEPRDGLFSFEIQLNLPAESVKFDELFCTEPIDGYGRDEDDVVR